ncbi:MAG: Mov34/MPN/PAD-1 family protein [Clostridiales Family XIII bacterium]|jgi:proteasome lid subunit RPN8/RPN11|nr:Mov34/MPN/PAD-1 family protein [Clostridiales Family XIII bacterium]
MHILDSIGNTPLLSLERIAKDAPGVRLLGKAEFSNPSGSVKDRAAHFITGMGAAGTFVGVSRRLKRDMTRLSAGAAERIRAEGERLYPDECCGLLLGREAAEDGTRVILEALPTANAREAGERHHRFVIEADDFLRGELAARAKGLAVVGVYHSHPDHPALPSAYDREHALPYYSYIIVAVENGRSAAMNSFVLDADRSGFSREEMVRG